MKTLFNASLLLGLPSLLECKSITAFLKPLNVSRSTWKYWEFVEDIPLCKLLDICAIYGIDVEQFFINAKKSEHKKDATLKFRNVLFSDALTAYRHTTVVDVCTELGISTATFARQLRPKENSIPSVSACTFIEWCNRTNLNPLDYIYEGEVCVKVDY